MEIIPVHGLLSFFVVKSEGGVIGANHPPVARYELPVTRHENNMYYLSLYHLAITFSTLPAWCSGEKNITTTQVYLNKI